MIDAECLYLKIVAYNAKSTAKVQPGTTAFLTSVSNSSVLKNGEGCRLLPCRLTMLVN